MTDSPIDPDTLAVLTLIARGKVRETADGYAPAFSGAQHLEPFSEEFTGAADALRDAGIAERDGGTGLTLTPTGWEMMRRWAFPVLVEIQAGRRPQNGESIYERSGFDDRYN